MRVKPRILYLYWMVSPNGQDHIACRRLINTLKDEYDVTLSNMVLTDDAYLNATDRRVLAECIPETDFREAQYDLIILEQCVVQFKDSQSPKIRALMLQDYVDRGGAVIFLAQDSNLFYVHGSERVTNAYLQMVGLPSFRLVLAEAPSDTQAFDQHTFGQDEEHAIYRVNPVSGRQRPMDSFSIEVNDQYLEGIDFHFREAYRGCQRLVVASRPLHLGEIGFPVLATGNPTTTTILTSGDIYFDDDIRAVFGACNDRLNGPLVTLTGSMGVDKVIDRAPNDNLRFISNLAALLLERRDQKRRLLDLSGDGQETEEPEKKFQDEAAVDRALNRVHAAVTRVDLIEPVLTEGEELLQVSLRGTWTALTDEGRQFLRTAEGLWRILRDVGEIDFAPVAVELCKALEVELEIRLTRPFGIYASSLATPGELDRDRRSSRRPELIRAVPRGGRPGLGLPLGQLARELEYAPSGKERIYEIFRTYVGNHCADPSYWLDPTKGPRMLRHVADRYRNGAAHTRQMTRPLLEEWRERLLGLQSPGWLEAVVSATASPAESDAS